MALDVEDTISVWFYNIKRCLTSLIIRKIQIKTTRYHFSPTSMAAIERERKEEKKERRERQKGREGRKERGKSVDEYVEKWKTSYIAHWDVK